MDKKQNRESENEPGREVAPKVSRVPERQTSSQHKEKYYPPNWEVIGALFLTMQENIETLIAQVGEANLDQKGKRALRNLRIAIEDDVLPTVINEARHQQGILK